MKPFRIVSTACVLVAIALASLGVTGCTTPDSGSSSSTSSSGGY
ncbi:hypothetical protein P3T43_002342 [Paraburkholderia sp. GAS41]|jgi:hypothetical protein